MRASFETNNKNFLKSDSLRCNDLKRDHSICVVFFQITLAIIIFQLNGYFEIDNHGLRLAITLLS